MLGLLAPVTKWNARISDPAIIPEVVRKAFKLAESEPPGPCHIELPEDVMAAAVDGSRWRVPRRRIRRPRPLRSSRQPS